MIKKDQIFYSESDVTSDQGWQSILGICALHLFHPKCTHTGVNTHTPWTHTRSSVQPFLCSCARGAVGGSVPCSRAPQSWYWGWRERCTFTPPTYNSCRTWDWNSRPLGYESDSLTIRPRLPLYVLKYVLCTCKPKIWAELHDKRFLLNIKKPVIKSQSFIFYKIFTLYAQKSNVLRGFFIMFCLRGRKAARSVLGCAVRNINCKQIWYF